MLKSISGKRLKFFNGSCLGCQLEEEAELTDLDCFFP